MPRLTHPDLPNPRPPFPSEATTLEPARYFQLLWQSGLVALPGPGDFPDYLKPERIQKTLSRGFEGLVGSDEKITPGLTRSPLRLEVEDLFYRVGNLPGWHLAADNTVLLRVWVLPDSPAAVAFAAFATGVMQASGALPSIAIFLNTVWAMVTTPRVGGITADDLALAGRLSEITR